MIPGTRGQGADVVKQTSIRLLSDACAGVQVWWWSVKETAQEVGLPGTCEASNDGYHISLLCTAGLQGLVNDLLSPLVSDHLRIWWTEEEEIWRGRAGRLIQNVT